MVLPWKNYLKTNEVSFITPDSVKYIAYPNGKGYILKIEDNQESILYDPNWELEKINLSKKYSDLYGKYEPCLLENLEDDDDKQCLFGKTDEGLYLDRIQRREEWMDHSLTYSIRHIENWGILHTPDGGKTLWKTDWCNSRNEYYNTMRCDVFPENPGWKQVDKAEILIELDSELSQDLKDGIINSAFPLPSEFLSNTPLTDLSIIDNVIIP